MNIRIVSDDAGEFAHIDDWVSLGAVLGVKTQVMSYALRDRDSMQTRIRIGDRTVYRSAPSLRLVQSRLTGLIEHIFDKVEGNGVVISYRKGLSPVDAMRELPHARLMVTFDIRHYYDNIRLSHMTYALAEGGMCENGARLAGRYCLVRRRAGPNTVHSLQQGCPASPAMSNLVGHHFLDRPVMGLLEEQFGDVRWHYRRYCDNIIVLFEDDPGMDRAFAFERSVQEALKENGFRTHKWEFVTDSHPKRHQRFLGMVLNDMPRIDHCDVDRLRAILFNWGRNGTKAMVEKFAAMDGVPRRALLSEVDLTARVMSSLRGSVGYVEHINEVQGLMLRKLFMAAKVLAARGVRSTFSRRLFEAFKSYRDRNEPVEEYMRRVREAMPAS